jgi:hypothetical protein
MTFKFIGIGVQKAGTSTLHDILKQHPLLELPALKESHFFNDNDKFNKGQDHYFTYYFNNKKKPFKGEIVPEYSYFDYCAERIKKLLGSIKIIIILRNPVERAYSHYLMSRRRGLEPLEFFEAIDKEDERLISYDDKINYSYLARGRYTEQIIRFHETFGETEVKTILFEDFINKTEEVVSEITEFVGLPPYNYQLGIKSNSASEPKSTILRDFIHKPNLLKKTVGKFIPSQKLKDNIMSTLNSKNLREVPVKGLTFVEKKKVYDCYYKEEIDALETLLNQNLSNWRY